MEIYIGLVIFIYGLVLGSFYNVVASRWVHDKSIKGRSKCDNCGYTLTAFNLIPVISYIIQNGKCSKCGKKLSIIYPLSELITGIGFLLVYLAYGLSIDFLIGIIFMSYIIISGLTDIEEGMILDRVVAIPTIIIFILTAVYKEYSLYWNIIPAIVVFLMLLIAVKLEKLGSGDVLIIASVFLVHGLLAGAITMFISAMSTLVYMLFHRTKRAPFIPFWVIGNIGIYILLIILQ